MMMVVMVVHGFVMPGRPRNVIRRRGTWQRRARQYYKSPNPQYFSDVSFGHVSDLLFPFIFYRNQG
jgi:hypothetical protein